MSGVHLWPMTWIHGISGVPRWDIPGSGWGKKQPMDGDPSDWTSWFMRWKNFRFVIHEGKAEIWVETSLHANNYTTGFKVHYHYTITGDGEIEITDHVFRPGEI